MATARWIETSHGELGAAQWLVMVIEELKWSRAKGYALLKIAQCPHFEESSMARLPADWTLLRNLAALTEEQFQKGIDTGIIHAGMERKDIKELKPPKEKAEKPKPKSNSLPESFDDWCGAVAINITAGYAKLSEEDRPAFVAFLRRAVDALGRE